MADRLPLLIFPEYRSVTPPPGKGFPPSHPILPSHARQVERLRPQLHDIDSEFQRFRGTIDQTIMGSEPELVLVLELADKIDNLARAVSAAGLEWLGEWDVNLEADEDFPATGGKSSLDGRLFVSMANQRGMDEILSLWGQWDRNRTLPRGKTKWRDIFDCLKIIRRWGIQETLNETGMRDYFENFLDGEVISFQIECFYREDPNKRNTIENEIRTLLSRENGETISDFIHIPEIEFHAVKARMPAANIKILLHDVDANENFSLLLHPSIMYFRRTGQNMASNEESEGEEAEYPPAETQLPPVAAVLDGAPNMQHNALKNFVDFDDPFDLTGKYLPGERRHGTAMASLLVHGDRSGNSTSPIRSRIHHVAVMEPDLNERARGNKVEHFPADCFCEDRIERAVRRMLDSDGGVDAMAPGIKIINISLGDESRPFIHTPSPWARLLDWLSWKYRVLFCVSAGNYDGNYDFGISYVDYQPKSDTEKTQLMLDAMRNSLPERRLLAPAESINALTVGALHQDESGNNYYPARRVDILPNHQFVSPVSRFGHGFRRSVKPEIYFPGGRQLYTEPLPTSNNFVVNSGLMEPGQKIAWDSDVPGKLSQDAYSRGTSNATALATRAGVQIHEVLSRLNSKNQNQIPENLIAVLIKTLLVHGSGQSKESQQILDHLKNSGNSRNFRSFRTRFLGYGSVDVTRVLECTEQRGTVLGFGEITTDKIHEYRFPIPDEFGGQQVFRRMVVTLAWFSPINMRHRYLREAKLEIKPGGKWNETPLRLDRTDGDHHQVKRGTVQHEVLEGKNELSPFQQDAEIILQVVCKKDATENLQESIPYGVAVTLEVAEGSGIPVYMRIRDRLSEQIAISATPT